MTPGPIRGCVFAALFQLAAGALIFGTCTLVYGRAEEPRTVAGELLSIADKHTLAITLVGEADWSRPDWQAMSWVLLKRYKLHKELTDSPVTFGRYVKRYSAVWRAENKRAKRIRALPWGPKRYRNQWGGRRWDVARDWVEHWSRGWLPDPCPKAWHWGGSMDPPHKSWRPVDCGRTKNIFYAVR